MRRWMLLLGCGLAAACADILGIDDGTPRTYDASVDAAPEAAPPDAAKEAAPSGTFLHCGTSACDLSTGQSCCWSDAGFGCVDAASACNGVDIPCDRPEECAQPADAEATVCCANYTSVEGGAVATAVGCIPASKCNSTYGRFVLCGDDSGVECGPDASCGESNFSLPTFLICR